MRNDKHLAVALRRKGLSYKKIETELGIARSTLSDWFSHEDWSQVLRQHLVKTTGTVVSRFQRQRWETWRERFRQEARIEFNTLKKNPLFIAGIMLYWGEGDSRVSNGMVRLVNTDPRMIALYCSFLRNVIHVPENKIKASLVLYPDLSNEACIDYWSVVTKIPRERFHKTQFINGRHPTKKTMHGMCTIYVSGRGLKEKIVVWTDLLYKTYGDQY